MTEISWSKFYSNNLTWLLRPAGRLAICCCERPVRGPTPAMPGISFAFRSKFPFARTRATSSWSSGDKPLITHTHTCTHYFNGHFSRWTSVNQLYSWFSSLFSYRLHILLGQDQSSHIVLDTVPPNLPRMTPVLLTGLHHHQVYCIYIALFCYPAF